MPDGFVVNKAARLIPTTLVLRCATTIGIRKQYQLLTSASASPQDFARPITLHQRSTKWKKNSHLRYRNLVTFGTFSVLYS
jgi:hypothetical protein